MSTENNRAINTEELATAVLDELEDFRRDGYLNSATYSKKTEFSKVLQAINIADRIATRDLTLTGLVVLYLPAGESMILFQNNHQYKSSYITNLNSQSSLSAVTRQFFLASDRYIDVISIEDQFIYVYDDFPTSGAAPSSRFKKVSKEMFDAREDEIRQRRDFYFPTRYYEDRNGLDPIAYFYPNEQRLVLDSSFQTGKFVQFEGRIMPGILKLKSISDSDKQNQDWKTYQVKSPAWFFEYLIKETLLHLLPMTSKAYPILKALRDEARTDLDNSKPSDSTIVIPHFSY